MSRKSIWVSVRLCHETYSLESLARVSLENICRTIVVVTTKAYLVMYHDFLLLTCHIVSFPQLLAVTQLLALCAQDVLEVSLVYSGVLSCHVSPDVSWRQPDVPDVNLTSDSRSPDETDGAAGSVTHSIYVRFTSNFVHLHSLPPLQGRIMLISFL